MATDLSVLPVYTASLVSARANLAERLMKRLATGAGSLFYDASYGYDLRTLLSAKLTSAKLLEVRQLVRNQFLLDDDVLSASVLASFNNAGNAGVLTIEASIRDSQNAKLELAIYSSRDEIVRPTQPASVLYQDSFTLGVML